MPTTWRASRADSLQLDRDESRMAEPELAHRIGVRCSPASGRRGRAIPPGASSPTSSSSVLRPCRRRRRAGRTAPPAASTRASRRRARGRRVVGEELGAAAARSSSTLDRVERHAGTRAPTRSRRCRRRSRCRSRRPARARASRQHVQQPAGLGAARARRSPSSGGLGSARSTSGGVTFLHYSVAEPPAAATLRPRPRRRGLAGRLRGAVRGRRALARAARARARGRGRLPRRARRRRRPEHVLHAGLRALRRRPLGTGAVDDTRRLCEFVYRNLGRITQIVPTLDTHQAMQIFHPSCSSTRRAASRAVHDSSRPPTSSPGAGGSTRPPRRRSGSTRTTPRSTCATTRATLEEGGKYSLTVWPFHAMLGGIGYALVSAVEEALFFHAIARCAPLGLPAEGDNPLTEHYSMLGPEVEIDTRASRSGSATSRSSSELLRYDAVVIAGPGEEPLRRLDDPGPARGPDRAGAAPRGEGLPARGLHLAGGRAGVVDYTDEADAAFARFAESGAHVVRSDDADDGVARRRRRGLA